MANFALSRVIPERGGEGFAASWEIGLTPHPPRYPVGHMAPLPGKCPLGLKLSRVPQGGLNITFKPKSPNQVPMDVIRAS